MNYYVTNRVPVEAFEYDPYDKMPEWWEKMVSQGKAFQYKETKDRIAYGSFFDGDDWITVKVGDKVCIDITKTVFKLSAGRFSKLTKPVDRSNEAAPMFIEKIKDAVYQFIDGMKK